MTQQRPVWQAKKNKRGWEAINLVTGEVVPLAGRDAVGRPWPEQHIWLFQDALQRLARDTTFGQQATRVLLYLLTVLEWDNWLVVPHTVIGEALGMQAPNVSRAIAELLARKVLLQADAPAPRTAYQLNSALAYKGRYMGLRKRRREEARQTQAIKAIARGEGE